MDEARYGAMNQLALRRGVRVEFCEREWPPAGVVAVAAVVLVRREAAPVSRWIERLADHQAMQFFLADSAMDLYAARMPHAHKLLLPGSGHMTLMEFPDAVADAVRSLVEDTNPNL